VATTAGVEIKFTQVPGYVCQLVILNFESICKVENWTLVS